MCSYESSKNFTSNLRVGGSNPSERAISVTFSRLLAQSWAKSRLGLEPSQPKSLHLA
jgi:hypothetical protein